MLAQTCPMTTLTVVNVDAVDRPTAPSVHDCRRRARSCEIAKLQCRLRGFVRTGGFPMRGVWSEGVRRGLAADGDPAGFGERVHVGGGAAEPGAGAGGADAAEGGVGL